MAIYVTRPKHRQWTAPDGSSLQSPKAWTDFCASGTSASLEPFFSEDESSVTAYFIVQLTANTQYTMSYGSSMGECSLELKTLSGTTLKSQTADYDEETGDYIDIPIKYTPSATGLFIVYANSYGYDTLNISPRPPAYTNAGWSEWETSAGFVEAPAHTLERFFISHNAGLGAGYPRAGLLFHTSFASLLPVNPITNVNYSIPRNGSYSATADTGETMQIAGEITGDGTGGQGPPYTVARRSLVRVSFMFCSLGLVSSAASGA